MDGITNSNYGGGSGGVSLSDPIIHVNVLAGSTVTFSLGGVVVKTINSSEAFLNVDGSTSDYYFSTGVMGTYTITASCSPFTAQRTVSVSSVAVYETSITYELYLYNYGTYNSGYVADDLVSKAAITDESDHIYINGTAKSIQDGYKRWASVDLTNVKSIVSERAAYSSGTTSKDRYCAVFVTQDSSVVNARSATIVTNVNTSTAYNTKTNILLDVSDLTGLWYVVVGMNTNGASWTNSRKENIYSVKLTA